MKGLGTDEDVLVEQLCQRSNDEMDSINAAYLQVQTPDSTCCFFVTWGWGEGGGINLNMC